MSINNKNKFKKIGAGLLFYTEEELSLDLINFFVKEVSFDSKIKKFESSDNTFGRAQVIKLDFEQQFFIIRIYKRGGFYSKITESLFLKSITFPLNSRPFNEYQVLRLLKKNGIRVPSVTAFILKPSLCLFYKGALITKEILGAENLLSHMLKDGSSVSVLKIAEYSFLAAKEAIKALNLGILHVDLHPGNVLVETDSVYLIDFDKAKVNRNQIETIKQDKDFLCQRWNRSIEKRIENKSNAKMYIDSFYSGVWGS
jgi:tRNA A-37 threonylcarbamoyl transferase component Bud32